jgi:hypothetical protein
MLKQRLFGLSVCALALSSAFGPAAADPQPKPIAPLPRTFTGRWPTDGQSARDTRWYPSPLEAKNLGLADFSFRVAGGDREVRSLGVATAPRATGKLGGDQEYPYAWRIGVHPLTNIPYGQFQIRTTFQNDCAGACRLRIENRGLHPGHHFVLSSFVFDRRRGDANVRRITVMPYPDQGYIDVAFTDNGAPVMRAAVSYAYIPDRYFSVGRRELHLRYRPGSPAPREAIGAVKHLLVGFNFEFENGDHRLGTFGIEYAPPYLSPRFSDQNTDDPWRATIVYAVLNH